MASINSGYRFLFADGVSDEYNLMLAYFNTSDISSNDEVFEIVTSTNPYIDTWNCHGKVKSEPLKFPITVVKMDDSSGSRYFDTYEERAIKKWLIKNERNWFQVDQEDMADIFYYCHMTFDGKENVATGTAGLKFQVVCDTNHAWSGLIKKSYPTVNNTLTFSLNSVVDFDNYIIYPTLVIQSLSNGNISIKNNTTNEIVNINNCSINEIITLDNSTDKIKSSTGRNLISDWNKQTLGIIENKNEFTLTGNFKVEFQYRNPIRVGG